MAAVYQQPAHKPQKVPLTSLPTPTKTNYSFDGWYVPMQSAARRSQPVRYLPLIRQFLHNGHIPAGLPVAEVQAEGLPPAAALSPFGSTAITTMTAKTGSDGTASAVTQSQISSAIKAAQEAAKSNGESRRVEIQVSGTSDARAVETTMPKSAVQSIVTGEMDSLALSSLWQP